MFDKTMQTLDQQRLTKKEDFFFGGGGEGGFGSKESLFLWKKN